MTEAAPTRFFGPSYVEHVTLRDGTPITVRLVRPADKDLLEAGFDRLSPQSRYARFLAPKTSLKPEELRYLTEVDQENHFALGAIYRRDEDARAPADDRTDASAPAEIGLGIARFIRLAAQPTIAEAAIAVADEAQGKGLGRLLFMRLCAAAAERGVERFRCEVLGSNTAMSNLIEDIAPARSVAVESGQMSIEMIIPGVEPTTPFEGPVPETPMYRLFRAAAKNAVEWTDAVRRLWRR